MLGYRTNINRNIVDFKNDAVLKISHYPFHPVFNHFNENELRQIVIFYNSPAGMAWLEKRPGLRTEGEQIGLEWGQLLMRRVLKRFEEQTGEKF